MRGDLIRNRERFFSLTERWSRRPAGAAIPAAVAFILVPAIIKLIERSQP